MVRALVSYLGNPGSIPREGTERQEKQTTFVAIGALRVKNIGDSPSHVLWVSSINNEFFKIAKKIIV